MKKVFFVYLLMLLPALIMGQGYVGKKMKYVKKTNENYFKKNHLKFTFSESLFEITYLLRDSFKQPADFSFKFDAKGKCEKEIATFYCDSCFIFYTEFLKTEKNKFFRFNENTYYTEKMGGLKVELDTTKNFVVIITKANFSARKFEVLKAEGNLYKAIYKQ